MIVFFANYTYEYSMNSFCRSVLLYRTPFIATIILLQQIGNLLITHVILFTLLQPTIVICNFTSRFCSLQKSLAILQQGFVVYKSHLQFYNMVL